MPARVQQDAPGLTRLVVGKGGAQLDAAADGGVDVEVTDQSPDIPAAMERAPSGSASYRGLAVVSAISHSWGVVPEGSGKRVWARLAPPAPPPTANR